MDRLLVARVLLTLATLGYGLLTVTADFNKTHATNSLWTGHARFHVVWQIASYVGFGAIALWVIWARAKCNWAPLSCERFRGGGLAYGGRAYDDNGYLPFAVGR